jgi:ankyrin repeat protein
MPVNSNVRAHMDDQGVVGLVDAYEHSVAAGIAVAVREPRLIRERTSLGETALHLLVLGESEEAVRSILQLGADPAALCDFGESPLSLAASLGRASLVRTLLQAGAPLAADGQLEPTLHKAVRSGSVETVRLILEAGADVNEQTDFAEAPIHLAAEDDLVAIAELLIASGADPLLQTSFDGTALDVALRAGSTGCVALLTSKH